MKLKNQFSYYIIALSIILSSCNNSKYEKTIVTTSDSLTQMRSTNDIRNISTLIIGNDIRRVTTNASGTRTIVCIYPERPTPDSDLELQVYYPGITDSKPTNIDEIPFLYYIEIENPLPDNIRAIRFEYNPVLKEMAYSILNENLRYSDTSAFKCPPECDNLNVVSSGIAIQCPTALPDCPPESL